MFKRFRLTPYFETPVAGGAGAGASAGTTGNVAGSSATGSSASGSGSTGNVTSGTASEALIKAAMASSSEAPPTTGVTSGDTTGATGAGAGSGTNAAATGQASQDGSTAAGAAAGGAAPDNRIQAAVRNARAGVLQTLGLPPNLDPRTPEGQKAIGHLKSAMALAQRLATPESAKAFYEELGRAIGGTGQAQAGTAEAGTDYPDPDLVSQDGKVKAYSHEAFIKAQAITAARVKADVLKELGPVISEVNGIRTERESLASQRETQQVVGHVLGHARKLPHFSENEKGIVALLGDMDPVLRQRVGPLGATFMAYGQMLAKTVIPNLRATIEKEIRAEFAKDANASRGHIAPNGSAGSGVKTELNGVNDLAKHMERMAAAG
jgi:hypothetical protein